MKWNIRKWLPTIAKWLQGESDIKDKYIKYFGAIIQTLCTELEPFHQEYTNTHMLKKDDLIIKQYPREASPSLLA